MINNSIYNREMNRTLDENKPYESWNETKNKQMPIGLNHSYQNLRPHDNESSTLSGLSLKDEWTEIQLYSGILSKMRKDHEHMLKKKKIEDVKKTLKSQIVEKKEFRKKEMEEK